MFVALQYWDYWDNAGTTGTLLGQYWNYWDNAVTTGTLLGLLGYCVYWGLAWKVRQRDKRQRHRERGAARLRQRERGTERLRQS